MKQWLILVLAVALALRLSWVLTRPPVDVADPALADQRDYLAIAQNVLAGRGFEFRDVRFGDTVYAFRTPGYPLFLVACAGSVSAARVAQAVIDTLTVLAAYLLASKAINFRAGNDPARSCALSPSPGTRGEGFHANASVGIDANSLSPLSEYRERGQMAPSRPPADLRKPRQDRDTCSRIAGLVPIAAAIATAFNPYLIYFSGLILSETLFTGLVIWSLVLLVGWPRYRGWVYAVTMLTFSVLVRPSAIALPILLSIVSVWTAPIHSAAPGQSKLQQAIRRTLLAIFLLFVCLFPWAARNRIVLGRWVWLDTNSGFTWYDGYNLQADGSSNQSFARNNVELLNRTEISRSTYLESQAWDFAVTHPRRVFELVGARLARTWSPIPLSNEYGKLSLKVVALAYSLPFDLLLCLGLLRGRFLRSMKFLLVLPALYLTMIHALTVGSLRYRIPAEPPLAVVAAAGVCAVAARRGSAVG